MSHFLFTFMRIQTAMTAAMPKTVTAVGFSRSLHFVLQVLLQRNCPGVHSEHCTPVYPASHSNASLPLHDPIAHGKKYGGSSEISKTPEGSKVTRDVVIDALVPLILVGRVVTLACPQ